MTGPTLGSWVRRRAERTPGRVALRFEEASWTYAELDLRIRRLAQALRAMGVRPGDRVGYVGPNHPAFLELLFAAAGLGAITLPVNHRLPADTVEHIVRDSGCRLIVYSAEASVADGAGGAGDLADRLRSTFPAVTFVRLEGSSGGDEPVGYEELLTAGSAEPIDAPVRLDDAALLVYTSGTTGLPKGVTLTHESLTWNVFNVIVSGDLRSDDVTLAIAPFFRVGGLGVTVLETLLLGGSVVVMRAFDPGEALELIETHKVSVLFGGPDLLQALITHPSFREDRFASVRVCYTGGAPVPHRMLDTYLRHDIAIIQGYGLSEASPVALLLDSEDMARKAGSAGRPVFFTDVRIVGPDGTAAEAGQVGEVLVAGPNIMQGYWNRERPDEHLVDGRWLRTGDAARMDEDGYVTIVGRTADAYVTAGRLVHPGDLESVLRDHPAVADVAVVPFPDTESGTPAGTAAGTVGVAFVESAVGGRVDPDELLTWAAGRIDPAVLPRAVRLVDELPRNPAGKVLRARLGRHIRPGGR